MRPLSNPFDRLKDPNLFATVRKFNRLIKDEKRPPNGQWTLVLSRLTTLRSVKEFARLVRDHDYIIVKQDDKQVPVGLGETGNRAYIVFTHPDMETLKKRHQTIIVGSVVGLIALLFFLAYFVNL